MEHGMDKRLDHLLETYGASRTRWPAGDRGRDPLNGSTAEAEARAIDAMLSLATVPEAPDGAMTRLMDRIGTEPQAARVIAFQPRVRRPSVMRYAAALPLAASLALGIYLGAQGFLDFMLPTALTGDVALIDDTTDDLGGVGEADAYAEENLS